MRGRQAVLNEDTHRGNTPTECTQMEDVEVFPVEKMPKKNVREEEEETKSRSEREKEEKTRRRRRK
jgi:hypothetical protein